MSERRVAVGLSSEYLRIGLEPPIVDQELIDVIHTGLDPAPQHEDGGTVFFVGLPEGLNIQSALIRVVTELQKAGDKVSIHSPVVFGFDASVNPLEVARRNSVNEVGVTELEFFDAPILDD